MNARYKSAGLDELRQRVCVRRKLERMRKTSGQSTSDNSLYAKYSLGAGSAVLEDRAEAERLTLRTRVIV